jgi:peroxiredoxin
MLCSLWLFALGSVLAGPPHTPPTVLSGHVAHAPAHDTLWVKVKEEFVPVPLDAKGDFRVELPTITAPLPLTVDCVKGLARLYVVPGDQLHMRFDYQDFGRSITYTGRGAAANNYLAQARWRFKTDSTSAVPRPLDQLKPTTTPAEMRRNADVYRQRRLDHLTAYAKGHPLPAGFQRDMEVAIATDWAAALLLYGSSRYRSVAPGMELPASYYDFMAQVPVKELTQHYGRSIFDNSQFINLTIMYGRRLLPSGDFSTDPTEGPRLYQLATAELGEGEARDRTLLKLLEGNIRHNLPGARAFYATFRQHNADSAVARAIRADMARVRPTSAGQPAPAFTLTDNTGKQVSLADLRGKVVYLDFWGTWCAPCMTELTQHSHALKKQFEGRDVAFVYISVNDAEAKWQRVLADKQLGSPNSVHLRSPNDDVPTAYEVQGYPTYWLIDRAGRIVDTQAPRPSEGAKTVAAIEEVLAR